ncbi:hypothetical protein FOL75_04740 [Bacillus thuringiensis]|uniref:hypothetical protein n=1 Tax=Bacillus thuringiensis TaxID=1428 RepID=UPI002853ED5D|nr:hypothetical protein [Bacillus thuringiensis]MDR5021377.1 hypothetical protein [Bacillus thuringiensis]
MKLHEKNKLYRLEEYTQEQLYNLNNNILCYAQAINGLPRKHTEIFEKRGWLLPYLYGHDSLLWKRWDYWFEIIERGTITQSGSIPQIEWSNPNNTGFDVTKKMLEQCLNYHESGIDTFAHWLHWGLAITNEKPKISKNLNEHYYKNFDIFLMQKYPSDYMSIILYEETGKGYKNGLGYFPTPFQLSIMMIHVVYKGIDNPATKDKYKGKTVYDPCVGCGSTFLPASNYSLKGYAQDVSKIALDLLRIQCMLYAPWFAFHPENIRGFEEDLPIITSNRINRNVQQLELIL